MHDFIERHGYLPEEIPIKVREEATSQLRDAVLNFFKKHAGHNISHSDINSKITKMIVQEFPLTDSKGYPYYDESSGKYKEIAMQEMIKRCEWYYVYCIIEYIYECLKQEKLGSELEFEKDINNFLYQNGIGFLMESGRVIRREDREYSAYTEHVNELLENEQMLKPKRELNEAWFDISRKPNPDISGAIQHIGAAIECLARSVSNNPKRTFGDIIKCEKELFPEGTIKKIAEGLWGFVSNNGRHITPDQKDNSLNTHKKEEPTLVEAIFMYGSACILCNYVLNKNKDVS